MTFLGAAPAAPVAAASPTTDVDTPANKDTASTEQEIELDELNRNPCMMTILSVIDHCQEKFGPTYDKAEMPKWMFEIHSKFVQTGTLVNFTITLLDVPNVLLFITKIIINKPEIFAPYAKFWVKSILRVVISGYLGQHFNYFLRDVCILLMKWNVIPEPEERDIYSQFMVTLLC
jgi:hypothetical protein